MTQISHIAPQHAAHHLTGWWTIATVSSAFNSRACWWYYMYLITDWQPGRYYYLVSVCYISTQYTFLFRIFFRISCTQRRANILWRTNWYMNLIFSWMVIYLLRWRACYMVLFWWKVKIWAVTGAEFWRVMQIASVQRSVIWTEIIMVVLLHGNFCSG